ncbi:hypothetical protein C8R47DRAFT_530783 [Mycena vitilis]|nr:hypothetical protein C8R47DRAFT_530783 [Mycena vitilis]
MPVEFSARPYDSFRKQIQLELKASGPLSIVKIVDRIAYRGQDISLDYQRVLDRVRGYSTYRPRALEDLFVECIDFFGKVLATSRACNRYLACVYCLFNPNAEIEDLPHDADPESALRSFDEQYEELLKSIERVVSCWSKAQRMIMDELQGRLHLPLGFACLLRAESAFGFSHAQAQLLALRDDLPTLMDQARLHCYQFRDHYISLHSLVKQVDTARVGASDAIPRDAALDIAADGDCIIALLFTVMDYKLQLQSVTGRESVFPDPFSLY